MDIRCFFLRERTMEEWDKVVLPLLADKVKKPRKKYQHTPKFFKKKMLQELRARAEHLAKEKQEHLNKEKEAVVFFQDILNGVEREFLSGEIECY